MNIIEQKLLILKKLVYSRGNYFEVCIWNDIYASFKKNELDMHRANILYKNLLKKPDHFKEWSGNRWFSQNSELN